MHAAAPVARSTAFPANARRVMGGVAIYTAIFGGHDDLRPQPACPGVDYVCFTDDPAMASDQWRVEVSEPRYGHPRLASKWFRTHPHVALAGYRYTIWIDGSFQLKSESFADDVLSHLGPSGFALPAHPRGPNLIKEVNVSERMSKYEGQPVRQQLEHYMREGLPVNYGLWATGLLVRDNENEQIRRLDEMWMEENLRWTYQDQISLPYLFWRLGIEPDVIPLNGRLRDNWLFGLVPHRNLAR